MAAASWVMASPARYGAAQRGGRLGRLLGRGGPGGCRRRCRPGPQPGTRRCRLRRRSASGGGPSTGTPGTGTPGAGHGEHGETW